MTEWPKYDNELPNPFINNIRANPSQYRYQYQPSASNSFGHPRSGSDAHDSMLQYARLSHPNAHSQTHEKTKEGQRIGKRWLLPLFVLFCSLAWFRVPWQDLDHPHLNSIRHHVQIFVQPMRKAYVDIGQPVLYDAWQMAKEKTRDSRENTLLLATKASHHVSTWSQQFISLGEEVKKRLDLREWEYPDTILKTTRNMIRELRGRIITTMRIRDHAWVRSAYTHTTLIHQWINHQLQYLMGETNDWMESMDIDLELDRIPRILSTIKLHVFKMINILDEGTASASDTVFVGTLARETIIQCRPSPLTSEPLESDSRSTSPDIHSLLDQNGEACLQQVTHAIQSLMRLSNEYQQELKAHIQCVTTHLNNKRMLDRDDPSLDDLAYALQNELRRLRRSKEKILRKHGQQVMNDIRSGSCRDWQLERGVYDLGAAQRSAIKELRSSIDDDLTPLIG